CTCTSLDLFFLLLFFLLLRPPPTSTLFPYTTLFRSDSEAISVRPLVYEVIEIVNKTIIDIPEDKPSKPSIKLIAFVIPTIHITVDRKSTRLNSSHVSISYAVFCLKKKKNIKCYI